MICGHDDFAALVEVNASRWNEIKGDLSDWVVDKFVKRALGEIDDLVDFAEKSSPDCSLDALERARKRLNEFLDEWVSRKARRVAGAGGRKLAAPTEHVFDDDDDEDDED